MFTGLNRILPILFLICTFSCGKKEGKGPEFTVPYNLDQADEFDLAEELQEVSGISPSADGKGLWAINDETGKLYKLSFEGNIIQSKWFRKGGDYEDVVAVDSSVFVLKSNGNLYRIDNPDADSLTAQALKGEFKRGIEFESVALDRSRNRLLLLVKDGEGSKGHAPVYGYDLEGQSYQEGHVMLIDPRKAPGVSVKGKSLRASAMAIHPQTGHLYIVTSIQRMLLVCDKEGNGLASFKLSKKRFPQPEGICFLPNGDMFITSEGLSRPARLYRFPYLDRKKIIQDSVSVDTIR